jgi:hypothetical protein
MHLYKIQVKISMMTQGKTDKYNIEFMGITRTFGAGGGGGQKI